MKTKHELISQIAAAPEGSLIDLGCSGIWMAKGDAMAEVSAMDDEMIGDGDWAYVLPVAAIGKKGGQARTQAKVKASRANGKKGGRPKKPEIFATRIPSGSNFTRMVWLLSFQTGGTITWSDRTIASLREDVALQFPDYRLVTAKRPTR